MESRDSPRTLGAIPSAPNEKNDLALDSLPYIDQIHPDYEAYALSLIEEEMQKLNPPPQISYDAATKTSFKASMHPINIFEYENLVKRNGQPRSKVEHTDFIEKMKSKVPLNASETSQWKKAICEAKIELEYERLRQVNAELQSEYDTSLWKHLAKELELDSKYVKQYLEDQLIKVDQINGRRKEMQEVQAAPKIGAMNMKWAGLINKNSHLARGVRSLEDDVKELRKITGAVIQSEETNEHYNL